MSARLKESLMLELVAPQQHPSAKISIVGVGQVGMASAYSIMLQVSDKVTVIINQIAFVTRNTAASCS